MGSEEISKSKKSYPCISLVGMPGAGKSTVGRLLAKELGWAFIDTDFLLESLYGCRLQAITDIFGKEKFLEIEGQMIEALEASKSVIATGGSVIYSKKAMERLSGLGFVVYLELPLAEMEIRISQNPERGIAIAPGQTLSELYEERRKLYEAGSSFRYNTAEDTAEKIVARIIAEVMPKTTEFKDILAETGI